MILKRLNGTGVEVSLLEGTEEIVAGAPCVGETTEAAEAPPLCFHPVCQQW